MRATGAARCTLCRLARALTLIRPSLTRRPPSPAMREKERAHYRRSIARLMAISGSSPAATIIRAATAPSSKLPREAWP